jgi:hypothetical protein
MEKRGGRDKNNNDGDEGGERIGEGDIWLVSVVVLMENVPRDAAQKRRVRAKRQQCGDGAVYGWCGIMLHGAGPRKQTKSEGMWRAGRRDAFLRLLPLPPAALLRSLTSTSLSTLRRRTNQRLRSVSMSRPCRSRGQDGSGPSLQEMTDGVWWVWQHDPARKPACTLQCPT